MAETDKLKVMHVEDERIVSLEIRLLLQEMGFSVCASVPSGEEALRVIQHVAPDVILMDIRLEGELDGIDTTVRIREFRNVPVIYCTAYADEPTRQRADATCPSGYLLKPVSGPELRSAIERAVGRPGRFPKTDS